MSGERERTHMLGLVTWADLSATIGSLVGAVLGNDGKAVEGLRSKAHDLLDHHIDAKVESIAAIREDVKREFDGR